MKGTTFRKEMCCYGEINSVQKLCVVYFRSHHQQLKIKPRVSCSHTFMYKADLYTYLHVADHWIMKLCDYEGHLKRNAQNAIPTK